MKPNPNSRAPNATIWERRHLEKTAVHRTPGSILFWLPCESKEFPHPGPEPYAMDTRGELGEWRWRIKTEDARVVVGADPGFLGLRTIKRNFDDALGYDFPIYGTMEETAKAAVKMATPGAHF